MANSKDDKQRSQPGKGKRVCVVGASGKLGRHLIQHALDRGYEVNGVCREKSIPKLADFAEQITIFGGQTDDRAVIERAAKDCDAVLTVLVPWGVHRYATGTAQAVLDFARPDARLIFSCGWHVVRDDEDVLPWTFKAAVAVTSPLMKLLRVLDVRDQEAAGRKIFASDSRWTVARGSTLDDGPSQGLPVWSRRLGDPILASNRTPRVDYARFMVEAIENDVLIGEAPAIVGRQTPSARAHATDATPR